LLKNKTKNSLVARPACIRILSFRVFDPLVVDALLHPGEGFNVLGMASLVITEKAVPLLGIWVCKDYIRIHFQGVWIAARMLRLGQTHSYEQLNGEPTLMR
jgi:hypothetical protein